MRINIDDLSEDELIDLNHRIVARLRFLHEARAHDQMLKFAIGDRVSFPTADRGYITGTLTRYNKRTVTVVTPSGERWTVTPIALRHVREVPVDQHEPPIAIGPRREEGQV